MKTWRRGLLAWSFTLGVSCGSDGGSAKLDTTPPSFDGASEVKALADGVALVRWKPATDDRSPSERILYRVYASPRGQAFDFERPHAVSPAGATSLGVQGLPQGIPLRVVVRATDEAGNQETNEQAVDVVLPDLLPPQFAGVTELVPLSAHGVEVRWGSARDEVGVEGYLVYLSTEPNPFEAEPVEFAADQTSALFDGLEEATTYYAAVRAVDRAGNEDGNRRVVSATTLDVTPPRFDGLASLHVAGTAVLVRWQPATDNVTVPENITYHVYSAKSPSDFDFKKPQSSLKGATYTVLQDLEPSTTSYFAVRAEDEAGNQDENTLADSITTADQADSTPPSFAGAESAIEVGARAIEVSWSAGNDDLTPIEALFYDVWYSTVPGAQDFISPPHATSAPGATSVVVPALDPGTTYYFKVRARDLQGLRDSNDVEVSATTLLDDTPPNFAGVGLVTGIDATTLRISWLPAVDDTFTASELAYDIFVATSSGGQSFASPTLTVIGDTSAQISGLERETTYYVVVHARDPLDNVAKAKKEVAGSTLPDTTGPILGGPPTLLSLSKSAMRVSWLAASDDSYPSDELTYRVYYGTSSGGPYTAGPTTAAGVLTVDITDLEEGTYYVVVRARDPSGNQGPNSPQRAVLLSDDDTPPVFTSDLTLSAVSTPTTNDVTVTWEPATDDISPTALISYEVCHSTLDSGCPADGGVWVATDPGATGHTITGLPLDTKYWFSVRAVDSGGNRSEPLPMTTDNGLPNSPAAPMLAIDGANVKVTWTTTTDDVFSNLRYRVDYWRACDNSLSSEWLLTELTTPRTTGMTTTVPSFVSINYAQVVAFDGFGNARAGAFMEIEQPSASTVLQPLWNASCNLNGACHGNSGIYPAWNVTTALANPSPVYPQLGPVIIPDSLASRMYQWVSNGTMPPGGPVPTTLLCNLEIWIESLAP